MKESGDLITESQLELSWSEKQQFFDKLIEGGHKLRPIRFLIEHVIEKGYSKYLFAGSSLWSLLISLPVESTLDFTKTLRVDIDQNKSSVVFCYHNQLPRPKEYAWFETCQPTEIIDTFEYFVSIHKDWKVSIIK